MEQEEIETLERLRDQFNEGLVVKKTVLKARNIWNKYHSKAEEINYCMCTRIRRQIYAKDFIDWYEGVN